MSRPVKPKTPRLDLLARRLKGGTMLLPRVGHDDPWQWQATQTPPQLRRARNRRRSAVANASRRANRP